MEYVTPAFDGGIARVRATSGKRERRHRHGRRPGRSRPDRGPADAADAG
jgi:hypothetical protein